MNIVYQSIIVFILLLIIELIYFKIALKTKIYDFPNERSSHNKMTIRGGGVLFYFAVLIYFIFNPNLWEMWMFMGLTIISIISFIDDIKTVKTQVRLVFQVIGFCMILYQVNAFGLEGWKTIVIIFVYVCILNVYNFMDGINGMTGIYSLVTLVTMLYINENVLRFIHPNLIIYVILADIIFIFFNARKNAVCFAGDVGSICMGCIIIFIISRLIIMSEGQFSYMVLLIVYGADGGFTVVRRLFLKKNIFHPHRSQIFQLLSNEGGIPQVAVASIYSAIQLLINVGYFYVSYKYLYLAILSILLTTAHLLIYRYFDKKYEGKLIK